MSVILVSALLGVLLAGAILYLVRRDHLHGSYALWWLAIAIATLMAGIFPNVIDQLGHWIGIAYPPILAIIVGLGFILIHMLQMDIARSRQERALRRLTQRIAILDQELGEMRARLAASSGKAQGPAGETPQPLRKSAQVIALPKSNGDG